MMAAFASALSMHAYPAQAGDDTELRAAARLLCAKRCAAYGEPPCHELDDTVTFPSPCRECLDLARQGVTPATLE